MTYNGERGEWPDIDVLEYANPVDIITSATADSPLRLIDVGVSPFSFVEGARVGNLGYQINVQLAQLFARDPLQNLQRFQIAFAGVMGYLTPFPDGEHVRYSGRNMPGSHLTWTRHAARHINSNH